MNPTTSLTAPLRVIIVEDIFDMRQDLEEFFQEQPGFIVIGACSTVHDAIVLIHNTKPDLLLLDIGLPDGTGFDILEQIPTQSKVIFLTAHHEYAIRAFEYGAIHYLLKPFNEQKLNEALQRVINAQPLLQEQIAITLHSFRKNKAQEYIALRSQQFVEIVKIKEITYLQADNSYTTVFLNARSEVVTTKPILEYEELLENSFLRIHKSYLVNTSYIHRYHPKESIIFLKDATPIPVSNRKKEMVEQYLKTL